MDMSSVLLEQTLNKYFLRNLFSISPAKISQVALVQVNRLVTKQPSFLTNTLTFFIKEFDIILQVARFTQ